MHQLPRIYFKYCPNDCDLTLERKEKPLNICQETLGEDIVTIRFLSKPMTYLEVAFPAVT